MALSNALRDREFSRFEADSSGSTCVRLVHSAQEVDCLTKTPTIMPYLHKKVHDGDVYNTGHLFSSVADDGSALVFVEVGSVNVHALSSMSCGGNAYVKLFENVGISGTSGTALDTVNLNRTSSNTSNCIVFHSPGVSGGTLLAEEFVGAGEKTRSIGNLNRKGSEWVLQSGSNYLYGIENKSGGADDFSINIEFYEEFN